MAIDKHFRVKNGIKVGDVEVATSEGKIPASVVYVSNVTLTSKLGSVDITLSSLSAALGSYTDAVSVLNLIETAQSSASASLSSTLLLQVSASASESATQLAQSNAENHASDANLARQTASAAKVTAQDHKASASASKSAALVLKSNLESLKDSGSSSESAILALKLTASAAAATADSAKQAAQTAAGEAATEQGSALAHAQCALFAASSALSSLLSSQASSSAAGSARAAADIFAGNATDASTCAQNAAANAITQRGLAVNAQVAASAAASVAQVASGLALQYSEDSVDAKLTASSAAVTAQSKEVLAVEASVNSQTAANTALAAKATASSAASAALSSQNAATSANSSARSSFVAASNFSDKSASAATSASGSAATAEEKRGLAATAASNSSSSFSAANSAANSARDSASAALSSDLAASVSLSSAKSSSAAAQNFATSASNARNSASGSAAGAEEQRILAATASSNSNSSASAANLSANEAKDSASAALSSENAAFLSQSSARSSFAAAVNFAEDSASAAQSASSSAATAESKRTLAATAASNAASSLSAANSAAGAASLSESSAKSSFAAAVNFADDAASAAQSASTSAATAESKRGLAATAASNSNSSASAAQLSANEAANSLSAADSAKEAAAASESSARSSFAAASQFAEDSASAAQSASSSAATAESKRGLAATAASNASNSASSASASNVVASDSKDAASAAASAALSSEISASKSESSARSSFAAAEIFADQSASAAQSASSSSATAEDKRVLAASAASNASNSASSASASNVAAAGSASAALSSENAAFKSESSARSSFASAEIFADQSASAAQSASGSAATAEEKRTLAATAASNSSSSLSAANSAATAADGAASSANVSRAAAASSFGAAEIFAQDAATAASSSSSSRASAIAAKDIAVTAATSAETSANTVNLSSIAILNPSRVGTDENVWAFQPHSKNLDTNDSRFIQTGVFPNNSFVTDDATFGNAFVFEDEANHSFGPRLSFAYGSDKVYLMTVTYRTLQDSDIEYGGQYGIRTLLGATTRGDNGVTLAENIQDFEQRTTVSDGETVFAGVIHGEDYTDAELDSLPIITSTLTTNQDASITDRITTAHTFGANAGASGPATSISFAFRQNAGGDTTGQTAVKSFEVRDITETVLAQIESASAQRSASAANLSRAAAAISETNAASSESNASSAAASAVSAKELSANSETAAANSASAANSARASARAAELSAISSASNASSANASATNFKELAANSATAAQLSASSASASKAAAKISEDNAAQSKTDASSAQASAVSNKELSASSATLSGAAKDLSVSAQNAATEQAVENQNLIATGGFIGKNTFEDNDDGRWTPNNTPLIADEGLPAHPLGRTRAYKSDARDAYYSALNTNRSGFYEQSAHNRTFKVTGYCYNANVAGAGRPPVDARAGLRSYNGTNAAGNSQWPTIIAASAATTGWVYYSGTFTVDDSDGAYLAPFLQNNGVSANGDTLISYWTDMTLEDVTASEAARESASAANSARGAALISETAAASSATSANSAEGAAETSKLLAASAQLAANKDASSAESARAAAEIFESNASQAKVDAQTAQANAETARGLSVNAQTVAQNSASVASAASKASAQKNLNQYFFPKDSEGRGWEHVTGTGTEGGDPYLEWSDAAYHLPAYDNLKVGDVYRITGEYNTVGNSHNCVFMFREENGAWITNSFEVLEGDNVLEPGTSWSSFNILLRSKVNKAKFTIAIDTSDPEPRDDRLKVKNLLWVDVTEEYNSARSASSAQSSFGAADIARSEAVNAKTTASSASVSANEAKVLAVNAKTGAETAANGAKAAQAAALISEGNSVNAQTTATQAAASASSSKVLAASAAGAADAFAQSAFSSEQSASSFADQLSGELTTAVRDVNRISAEVQTGVDGHYAFRNQYTGRVGTSHLGKHVRYGTSLTTIDYASVIVNSENNDFGTSALGLGSTYNGANWSATDGTLQGSTVQGLFTQTGGSMAFFERTVTGFTANSTYFFTNDFASLGANSGYDIRILDANGNEVAREPGYYKNNSTSTSVPNKIRFTCTTTSLTIQVRVLGSVTLKNFFLTDTLGPVPVQDTSTPQLPGTTEDTQGFGRVRRDKDALTRFQNPEGASALFGDQSIAAIPENFSGKLMGLSWAGRNVGTTTDDTFEDTKIYIYSPYADTTVKLYMHVTSPGHSGEDITLMQGVTPPSATLNLKREEVLKLNLKDITTVDRFSGYSKEKLTLVLESTSNVLGYMYDDDHGGEVGEGKYYTPFVPLTNASAIYPSNLSQGSSSIKLDYPRFVTGGGINLASLEQLLESEAGGTLSSQAPTLSGILNQTRPDGKKFGDLTNDNNITASDADEVEKYRLGLLNNNEYHYKVPRLYKLINKLDENYDTLETTFTHNGQTYTLYNDVPLKNKTVTVNADTATTITSSDERLFIGASINNNNSNIAAMPVSGLSDFYRAAGVYRITVSAAEPCIVDVETYDSQYNVTSTSLDFSDASLTTPKTQTVDFNSSRVVIVKGDAPFSLVTRQSTGIHSERYGIRQTKAAQDSGATAIAKRVTETSSTVNEFTTTVTETAQSINGLEGQYSVKINNNGSISGFGISSTGINSASSAFIVQADRFSIVNPQDYSEGLTTNPSPESIPFEIRSGTALIKKAFIANLNAGNIDVGGLTGGNISASSVIAVYKTNDKENTYAALDGSDPLYRLYVGNPNPALARFAVTSSGDVRARSLTFNGVSGNYFSSEGGLGQAALNEISTFVSNNRRTITDSSVVYGDPNTSSASSYNSLYFYRKTDLYQKYRLDAADISFRKEVEHYSLVAHPLKAVFNAGSQNQQTLSVTNLTKPESALDSEGNPSFNYVPGQLNRAMQIGEVIQISWGSSNLPQNSQISGTGFVDADTGSSLNAVTIGPGTKYDTSVTIRISATTPKPTVTITRPSQGDLIWNPVYNAVATPDVVAQARAQIPSRIYLTPQRLRGAGSFASFMDDATGYNASSGALELEAIEAGASFTSLQTQYRVVTSPVSVGVGFISSTASIDTTPTIETGAVDAEGFLTAYTTILQTDEGNSLDNGGVITNGTTHYGLKVQFYSTFPTLLTGDHLTAATRIVESDGFVQFEEDYVHPVSKILLEQTGQPNIKAQIRPQICYQADDAGNADMAAYGLNFSGGAYTTIQTDFADHNPTVADTSKQSQVIILGNVSEDNTGAAADNFFAVASRPSVNNGDYDPKMMLRSTGELYIKDGNSSGMQKVATTASVNSLSSGLVGGTIIPQIARELRFGQDGSMYYENAGDSVDINLRHLAGSSTSPNKLRIRYAQANKFTFEGSSGNLTAAGNITAFSDERLKSDIKTLDGKKALSMRGVEFTKDGEKSSGVIAQELEKIAPELVLSTGDYKSVAYGNLVGYLIEAVKSQQTEIDRLTFIVKEMCSGASIDWPD